MSNALAPAAVTAVLKDLLNDALINNKVGDELQQGFKVTAQPPDLLTPTETGDEPRLNIFLYRVTPNTGWINERYPALDGAGARRTNPYLALDLHYMLSAFGKQDFHAEVLLGYGMQSLHDRAVLDRETIRKSLSPNATVDGTILPTAFQGLTAAELADQVEQLRISPHYVDLEDLSKLWSAINAPLRTSALYRVSVVLIESRASTKSALPVRKPLVHVRPLQGPHIDEVLSRAPDEDETDLRGGRTVVVGDRLVVRGSGLRGEKTLVQLGAETIELPTGEVKPAEIALDVPAAMQPGVVAVRVEHRVAKKDPDTGQELGEMPGELSNVASLVLSPSIDSVVLTDTTEDEGVSGTLTVAFDHPVGVRQRATIHLNRFDTPDGEDATAYSFRATTPDTTDPTVTQLEFAIAGVKPAEYLVRVRVDGADSALEFLDDGENSRYHRPRIEIAHA